MYNGDANIGNTYTYIADQTIDGEPDFPFRDALWYLHSSSTWSILHVLRVLDDRRYIVLPSQQGKGRRVDVHAGDAK